MCILTMGSSAYIFCYHSYGNELIPNSRAPLSYNDNLHIQIHRRCVGMETFSGVIRQIPQPVSRGKLCTGQMHGAKGHTLHELIFLIISKQCHCPQLPLFWLSLPAYQTSCCDPTKLDKFLLVCNSVMSKRVNVHSIQVIFICRIQSFQFVGPASSQCHTQLMAL